MGDHHNHEPQWIRSRTGKPYFLNGAVETLEPEFDWPDDTWVAFHFESHDSIGTDPRDSRPFDNVPRLNPPRRRRF
jgi:hypothetical protein